MTSVEDATDGAPSGDGGDAVRIGAARRPHSTRARIAIVAVLLVVCAIAARTCQQSQIRVTQDEAIATAKEQIDFTPTSVQVRLLRQGIGRVPFWIVSLSIPNSENEGTFRHLALVRIQANTGEIASVEQDSTVAREQAAREQEARQQAR